MSLTDLQAGLEDVMRRAAQGYAVLITSGDEVLAEIRPPPPPRPKRQRVPGSMRGRIWMAPDFDTLPDDIIAAMEGRDE